MKGRFRQALPAVAVLGAACPWILTVSRRRRCPGEGGRGATSTVEGILNWASGARRANKSQLKAAVGLLAFRLGILDEAAGSGDVGSPSSVCRVALRAVPPRR
jgi:hypothetical protein